MGEITGFLRELMVQDLQDPRSKTHRIQQKLSGHDPGSTGSFDQMPTPDPVSVKIFILDPANSGSRIFLGSWRMHGLRRQGDGGDMTHPIFLLFIVTPMSATWKESEGLRQTPEGLRPLNIRSVAELLGACLSHLWPRYLEDSVARARFPWIGCFGTIFEH